MINVVTGTGADLAVLRIAIRHLKGRTGGSTSKCSSTIINLKDGLWTEFGHRRSMLAVSPSKYNDYFGWFSGQHCPVFGQITIAQYRLAHFPCSTLPAWLSALPRKCQALWFHCWSLVFFITITIFPKIKKTAMPFPKKMFSVDVFSL